MKKAFLALAVAIALAGGVRANDDHDNKKKDDDHSEFRGFVPGSIVLSGSVYVGTADTVTPNVVLPPGCLQTGTIASQIASPNPATVKVPTLTGGTLAVLVNGGCGYSSDNGEAPNLDDTHNVWNNSTTDPSFGISSPIVLWNLNTDGHLLGALHVPSSEIVTSFSSKSELALNRSMDGKSLTFMGYRGGPGCPTLTLNTTTNILSQGTNVGPISPTAPNLIDVSASNTPGLCDPTNPAVASYIGATNPTAYYRSVAEVDAQGRIWYTDGDAYSSDNARAVIKADDWLYYSVGNDNNGGLKAKTFLTTQLGYDLSHSTGAELFVPGAAPLVPPGNNMISYFISITGDKPGKDTNFRGMTIFNNTLYVAKGSGSNGFNTVYQLGTPGVLPTIANAPAGGLITEPYAILPGFPNTAASTSTAFPFGIWFADANTLYVCDEGDGTLVTPVPPSVNVADAQSLATAGLQKWILVSGTWKMAYVLQDGLDIGIPYGVKDYPTSLNPATGGCRNITGKHNHNGTVTIYAITSTISPNGDTGADPNKLVEVTDVLGATTLPTGDGDHDQDDSWEHFVTIRSAGNREVFRGVAFAPVDHDSDDDHDGHDH